MEDRYVMKHKGAAKDFVDPAWYASQYNSINKKDTIEIEAYFRIDWKNLLIAKKNMIMTLGTPINQKRDNVYDEKGIWKGTRPKHILDYLEHHHHLFLVDKLIEKEDKLMLQFEQTHKLRLLEKFIENEERKRSLGEAADDLTELGPRH